MTTTTSPDPSARRAAFAEQLLFNILSQADVAGIDPDTDMAVFQVQVDPAMLDALAEVGAAAEDDEPDDAPEDNDAEDNKDDLEESDFGEDDDPDGFNGDEGDYSAFSEQDHAIQAETRTRRIRRAAMSAEIIAFPVSRMVDDDELAGLILDFADDILRQTGKRATRQTWITAAATIFNRGVDMSKP